MTGLLYKNFVAIKGKWIILGAAIVTILLPVIRIIFGLGFGVDEMDMDGKVGCPADLLGGFYFLAFCISASGLTLNWVSKMINDDKKNKIATYISSLPVGKNTYIAANYVFMGIVTYVLLSLESLWAILILVVSYAAPELETTATLELMLNMPFSLACFGLFVASIELPMNILLGVDKGKIVRVLIQVAIIFGAIVFILFGNLELLILDFNKIQQWLDKHQFEMTMLNILSVVILLGLYYLSFRLTCHFKKEED